MMAAEVQATDAGRLANNHIVVSMLAAALSKGDHEFNSVPSYLGTLLRQGCWREWKDPRAGPIAYGPDEFLRFIRAPRPEGLGSTVEDVARWLKPESDVWVMFFEQTRPEKKNNNPSGINQHTEAQRDNITLGLSPETVVSIPMPARHAPQGTSVSYAVRRLGKERPDLLDRVRLGELSPNAAMVAAGFRPKAITIPADPPSAARRLALHFKGESLAELIRELEARL